MLAHSTMRGGQRGATLCMLQCISRDTQGKKLRCVLDMSIEGV